MEAEESFELFESSQANKQNMTANTFSYAGTVVNGTKQSNDGNKSNHRVTTQQATQKMGANKAMEMVDNKKPDLHQKREQHW